jgi:hypothetical protein
MRSFRARQYRYKQAECERLAEQAKEPSVKTAIEEIAARWRELAARVEDLDRKNSPPQSK